MPVQPRSSSPWSYALLATVLLLAVIVAACWTVYDYTAAKLGEGLKSPPSRRGER